MNIYAMKKPKRINSVSVTLFILALIIGYLGYFFVPVYWPVFQLSGIMRGICNDAYRVMSDEVLMDRLLVEGRRTGLKLSKDNFRMTRLQYDEAALIAAGQKSAALRETMTKRGEKCRLEMRYADDYKLPFLDKSIHLSFDKTVEQSLEQVKWEKQCTCVTVPDRD